MRYHGLKGNMVRNQDATELEDKFDVLVDANDQILERVVSMLLFVFHDADLLEYKSMQVLKSWKYSEFDIFCESTLFGKTHWYNH